MVVTKPARRAPAKTPTVGGSLPGSKGFSAARARSIWRAPSGVAWGSHATARKNSAIELASSSPKRRTFRGSCIGSGTWAHTPHYTVEHSDAPQGASGDQRFINFGLTAAFRVR